jgi:TonB-dependent SusC/RagA subfamily outer membrane receptor
MNRWQTIIGVIALSFGLHANAQTDYLNLNNDSTLWNLHSGSTDKVTEDRMNKGLVTNPLNALSGQAAGVNVASSGADRMAMLSSVRVRGTTSLTGGNDPLVIIDGVSSDLATLSTIYPADIESFTILKNAAETAQYGSRGASGVIEVTTKKGHGGQFHISYDGNMGFESVYKNIKMLSGSEYVSTAKSLGMDYNDGGYDTDFPNSITRTGFVQNHHVAFSGGSENSNYRASIGFMNHNTVIEINKYQNFVAKLDLSQKAFDDHLTVDLGVFGSSQKNNDIFDVQKLFYSAATQNPTFSTEQNASGGWDKNSTASQINPPQALLHEKNDEKSLNFNTHLRLTFDIVKDLKLILFGSYSYNSTENSQFCPTWVWAQGQAYRGEHKSEDWLGNVSLNYQLHLPASTTIRRNATRRISEEQAYRFLDIRERFHHQRLRLQQPGGRLHSSLWRHRQRLRGPLAGQCDGKHELISSSTRYKFSLNNARRRLVRWWEKQYVGLFPFGLGRVGMKKEAFMKGADWLSQLKLRTGWGQSGNLGGIRLLQLPSAGEADRRWFPITVHRPSPWASSATPTLT